MKDFYYSSVTVLICDEIGVFLPVSDVRVPYRGEWALAKGDSVAQQEEQSEASFTQTLQQIFQSQYSTQQQTLQYLQGQLQPQIAAGGEGYTPAQLAAQRTQASDTNAATYQQAQQALNEQIQQRAGGSKLAGTSGADVEANAALNAQEAQVEANSQNQITTNNANLQQQNYWNSINALNGVAVETNPLGYSSAATSGANSVAGLSTAVTQSQQSGLLGALGGIAGGLASGWAAGGFQTGSSGTNLNLNPSEVISPSGGFFDMSH